MKKIKILYIIPRFYRAGTETHLLRLASGLNKDKFDITICCLFGIGEFDEGYCDCGFKIISLNRISIYDLRIISDLFRLIRKEKFDIVHTYLFGFQYVAAIPARLLGVPVIISSRREIASWRKSYHCFLENLGNLFTDKVIACSEVSRQYSLNNENLNPRKIVSIHNGINTNDFFPKDKNQKILREFSFQDKDVIIGMVTKLEEVKDIETAINAFGLVKYVYPEFKCLIVGDGHLKGKLKKKVLQLGLEKNVSFVGRRSDIADILSVMDVFVLTSISEGLPNAILEAMACGVPVVSTDVGGIPEVIENGLSGILVKPKYAQGISQAIKRLIEDKSLRKRIGTCAREVIVKRFDSNKMIRGYEEFYLKEFNQLDSYN